MEGLALELKKYKHIFVVCDRNVEGVARQIAGSYPLLAITADEAHKTIDTVLEICRWLMEQGADRDALVLAVGGGVTTDMAGFAASIYKRGIRYANVPTTLLSQIDAAIGGKTGVNLDGYKNLLGVIRQPEFTAIFPETLETLPEREFRSGMAEMLKTFIIKNPKGAYERTVRGSKSELTKLIQLAAGVKQEIVEKDEFEGGLRRKLNLGHTFAHAIEWWKPGKFTHGEAVAIGIVQAARISEKLGIAEEPGLADRIAADLKACGLPTELPCPAEELLPAILKDKKAEGGLINFVLPVKIGKVVVKKLQNLELLG
ncbi:MAG: 3-dehydroquinate synthase [Bacteroidales bacterium]|nr:3-dehydroquinate synthase [Bacteroidales bacterium]